MTPKYQKIADIVNDLSNEDIAILMEMLSHRVEVYVGSVGNHMISSDIESAGTNGTVVQINLELAMHENIMDDPFFAKGVEKHLQEQQKQKNVEELVGNNPTTD